LLLFNFFVFIRVSSVFDPWLDLVAAEGRTKPSLSQPHPSG
jgi:hypothetical protein